MAKKSRKNRVAAPAGSSDGISPRQPCPCGSGRRYKACHGAAGGPAPVFVSRPFEGMPSETDVVALRELVPAGTAPLTVTDAGDREVLLCTLLPGAAPALVRENGDIWLGLQVQHAYGDPSRDLGAVLTAAIAKAEAGESGIVGLTSAPGLDAPRLQDMVTDTGLTVTVHDGFDYWIADAAAEDRDALAAALDQANGAAAPTARLTGVTSAYWTHMGDREFLRWTRPEAEDVLLSALAILHRTGDDVLVEGARFVGMFRAHGLLTPVWDLPLGTGAEALEEPAEAFEKKLTAVLAELEGGRELTSDERSARDGYAGRQVTIR
ncbi:DUF5926 family protein [Nocardioides bruguierae]|uniref:SEC-C domain-containing protein n=1 Tax=Nocardioides bruguierae TaxID=2945102 RepID=A0A9X2D822_9ACTN|nr:DUF5926 family protein [Nocardioides bruguierae]MCM0621071.1 SEC-C domain-containing protein [Nocardioides bruguierae]